LKQVAGERIRDEIMLILSAANSASIIRMLDEDGVLRLVFPECADLQNLQQNDSQHLNVWQHSLLALESLEFFMNNIKDFLGEYGDQASTIFTEKVAGQRTRLTSLKLAVLLHSIGKSSHRSPGKKGAIHFHGHEITGADLAASLCNRLRLSNKEITIVSQLVRQQTIPVELFRLSRTPTRELCRFFRLGPELFWPLLLLFASDYKASQESASIGDNFQPLSQRIRGWLDFYYEKLKPRESEPLVINGHDIIENLNLSPGPIVGKILDTLAELQWEGSISTRQEALKEAARLLEDWTNRSRGTEDSRQLAADSGKRTAIRGQRSEIGGQRKDD